VFSLDSIITAVGMVDNVKIMKHFSAPEGGQVCRRQLDGVSVVGAATQIESLGRAVEDVAHLNGKGVPWLRPTFATSRSQESTPAPDVDS
jgi:hypothetical protein